MQICARAKKFKNIVLKKMLPLTKNPLLLSFFLKLQKKNNKRQKNSKKKIQNVWRWTKF